MKIIQGIIVYDITVPKFRRVLEKSLKDYGRRVQYSVFEFSLEEKIYNKMVKELKIIYENYSSYSIKNISGQRKKSIIIYKVDLTKDDNKFCFDKNDLKSSAINTSLLVIREILLPEVYFQPSASKNERKAHSNSDSQ